MQMKNNKPYCKSYKPEKIKNFRVRVGVCKKKKINI